MKATIPPLASLTLALLAAPVAAGGQEPGSVLVYPGSIRTFEEISEGLHPEVPEPLRRTVWVSLRLKKKKSS